MIKDGRIRVIVIPNLIGNDDRFFKSVIGNVIRNLNILTPKLR